MKSWLHHDEDDFSGCIEQATLWNEYLTEEQILGSMLPTPDPSYLSSSQPSSQPSYAAPHRSTGSDDHDSATMGAGAIAGLVVGGVLAVVGGAYALYYYMGQGHGNAKTKVSPPEDTKGLSSVVPEQPTRVTKTKTKKSTPKKKGKSKASEPL